MKIRPVYFFLLLAVVGVVLVFANTPTISNYKTYDNQGIAQQNPDESYEKMMDVLTHQRCMNCHPNDNIPKQGDDRHPHYFGMARGDDDNGFEATSCNTCHQSINNTNSGVPGAPHWSLAPASMGWEGLSRAQIAERLLDKNTNGNRSHDELVKHMTEDDLVLWAWEPGIDADGNQRTIPPVSKKEFKEAVENWFANGAIIPNK
ncbi:hypothetical protein [Maribacter stanieri]|jgi:hypothetical protein|uniref:Cytochrome c domain-containing protein n=1 Tax=Maribacter stanieri TaxID=440514 RepID=A0A1I6IDE5_9FLAO|nr:hypothetical protein [Maribacter stanieri]SFR64713.1 hypothetical protein SAMN04488010_1514 [Maribacter stanieri]|tara:strand:+ start:2253 stop:2864 length:612 start_codon:yes stop_codon:yes gene_type:complete